MRLKKVTSLPPQAERVWQVAIHPTLPLIATASSDKTARIISLQTYDSLSTIEGGHKRSIRSVAWKPGLTGESVLCTGSFDATIGIWRRYEHDLDVGNSQGGDEEEEEWRFALVLDGHESEVKSVAWSAGGNFLATCSRDKTVWIWEEIDEDNFETLEVMQEHTQDVKCVTWHPEEVLLASSSYDNTIRLYREGSDDWVCCSLLEGHTATVWTIEFEKPTSPGYREEWGSRLASCSDDLSIKVWTRISRSGSAAEAKKAPPSILRGESIEENWVETSTLPQVHTRAIYKVSWSSKSGRIVSCASDGRIVVYEEIASVDTEMAEPDEKKPQMTEWKAVAEIEGAHGVFEVNCVQWSKRWDKDAKGENDEVIVSCGDDGVVSVWELADA